MYSISNILRIDIGFSEPAFDPQNYFLGAKLNLDLVTF